MFSKILVLVISCVYCYGSDPLFRYDYDYNQEANGWLKLHRVPLNWEAARLQCQYEGAVLGSPLNKRLDLGIMKYFQAQRSCPHIIFSGVSASLSNGVYASIDGVPLERMPIYWSFNEPSRSDGCLVFYSNGTMGSKSCRESHPFVCYKEYQEFVLNACGTVDDEYQQFGNKTCYKYHTKKEDWVTAYKICMAEGGYLAITADYKNRFQRKQELNTVAIGFKLFDNIWLDVHGKPMVPQWQSVDNLSCGGRKYDGNFSPIPCHDDYNPFICEKAVDSLLPRDDVDPTL